MRIDTDYKIIPESNTASMVANYPSGVKFFSGFRALGIFRDSRIAERFWSGAFIGAFDRIVIVADSYTFTDIV